MNRIDLALFVYGTLRDREILEGVLDHIVPQGDLFEARARGWRTVYYPDRFYPALIRADQWAHGFVIVGLDGRDMKRLDDFEGDEYRRGAITVEARGGTLGAQSYFPSKPVPREAPPWSFETWTELHRPQTIARYRSDDFCQTHGNGRDQ